MYKTLHRQKYCDRIKAKRFCPTFSESSPQVCFSSTSRFRPGHTHAAKASSQASQNQIQADTQREGERDTS